MAEADPKLTMKISKIKNNRLLDRVQMIVNVYYDPKVSNKSTYHKKTRRKI